MICGQNLWDAPKDGDVNFDDRADLADRQLANTIDFRFAQV
jgi:hypothetical protein